MRKINFKNILFYLVVFSSPFFLMIMVNENAKAYKIEKGYQVQNIEAINNSKADPNQCTWMCHNNTIFCKEQHTKILNKSFDFTDPIYFGTIRLLMATGNYGAANILLYVVFFPLTIAVLIIWNRHLTIKIATFKKD